MDFGRAGSAGLPGADRSAGSNKKAVAAGQQVFVVSIHALLFQTTLNMPRTIASVATAACIVSQI